MDPKILDRLMDGFSRIPDFGRKRPVLSRELEKSYDAVRYDWQHKQYLPKQIEKMARIVKTGEEFRLMCDFLCDVLTAVPMVGNDTWAGFCRYYVYGDFLKAIRKHDDFRAFLYAWLAPSGIPGIVEKLGKHGITGEKRSDSEMAKKNAENFGYRPLTKANWDDFEALFGARGACGGCWCMSWRLPKAEFDKIKGEGAKAAMRAIVESGEIPGIIGYRDGKPVAWCAVAPRETYKKLANSRVLKPLDEKPVWSVVCLFVAKGFRRMGIGTKMLECAAEFAKSRGAKIVEGYPVVPKNGMLPDAFVWTGVYSSFEAAGFYEAGKHSDARPIMRMELR